jgi:hypothetical protein
LNLILTSPILDVVGDRVLSFGFKGRVMTLFGVANIGFAAFGILRFTGVSNELMFADFSFMGSLLQEVVLFNI